MKYVITILAIVILMGAGCDNGYETRQMVRDGWIEYRRVAKTEEEYAKDAKESCEKFESEYINGKCRKNISDGFKSGEMIPTTISFTASGTTQIEIIKATTSTTYMEFFPYTSKTKTVKVHHKIKTEETIYE